MLYRVPGIRPVSRTVWNVSSAELAVEKPPYAVVMPYWTSDVEGWSVVQVMVAVVDVMDVAVTAVISGGTGLPTVVNVKLPEVASVPEELEDKAAKL